MAKPTLAEALKKHGLDLLPGFNAGFIRNNAQWFTGKRVTVGDKTIEWAAFGDFSRDITEHWNNIDGKVSAEEQSQLNNFITQAAAENRKAREEHWEKLRPLVQSEWDAASDLGTTPYLDRKGFSGTLYGCRVEPHERGARLLVPARDASGTLWGYQRVYSEKLSKSKTDKIFREGARKEGCFHLIGAVEDGQTLFVCEGIATAFSIFEALDQKLPVVAAFDAGNFLHVARALRKRYPDTRIRFCADNDQFPARDGKIYHTGFVKAEKAAQEIGHADVVLPNFKPADLPGKPTDFNDLHKLYSLDEVKKQVLAPVSKEAQGVRPVDATDAMGRPKKPSEKQVARAFFEHFGLNLVKQGRDLFIYSDGFWQWQDEMGRDRLKQLIGKLYGNTGAGIKDIENTFRYVLVHAPTASRQVDLFVPPSFSCNFRNGTLHLRPKPGGEPLLEFLPHNREDYLTTQLPLDFPGLDRLGTKNTVFEDMLDRIFKGDPDRDSKIRVLAQMYGAVLLPCYAKVFFLVGRKGSGKSTIMKILHRLASKQNVSHVDPTHFSGFDMESMAGKLLNMVTDINLHKPINDSIIKQITDRLPFRVKRKFQTDLYAPLPSIHIWGGNDLPKSMEGATGAYERRVIIVTFGTSMDSFNAEALGAGGYDLEFDEYVWQAGAEGILAFAIQGAIDLVKSRGHYHVPASSRARLAEWDEKSDAVAQFLDALEHKELDEGNQYFLAPKAEIARKNLWACFSKWYRDAWSRGDSFSPNQLYDALRKKGFTEKRTKAGRYFLGIGMVPYGPGDRGNLSP